jgi:hypothetical protein
LMGQPQAFAAFLKQHWADAYSALFVFQIQPIDASFHCSVIHIVTAVHGKGNSESVSRLFELKDTLQKRFTFDVCGLAFDGDSRFNAFHRDFYRTWIQQMRDMPSFPILIIDTGHPLIISDPLHFLKRELRGSWDTDPRRSHPGVFLHWCKLDSAFYRWNFSINQRLCGMISEGSEIHWW